VFHSWYDPSHLIFPTREERAGRKSRTHAKPCYRSDCVKAADEPLGDGVIVSAAERGSQEPVRLENVAQNRRRATVPTKIYGSARASEATLCHPERLWLFECRRREHHAACNGLVFFAFFAAGWCFQRRCSQKYCCGYSRIRRSGAAITFSIRRWIANHAKIPKLPKHRHFSFSRCERASPAVILLAVGFTRPTPRFAS